MSDQVQVVNERQIRSMVHVLDGTEGTSSVGDGVYGYALYTFVNPSYATRSVQLCVDTVPVYRRLLDPMTAQQMLFVRDDEKGIKGWFEVQ